MTALVDEIGRGLHRILPSIITVIIAPELAQRRQFTQNGDGQLEQAAHPDGIVPLVVAMFATMEEIVAHGIGIGHYLVEICRIGRERNIYNSDARREGKEGVSTGRLRWWTERKT